MNDEDNDYGEEYEIERTEPREGDEKMEFFIVPNKGGKMVRYVFECGQWVEVCAKKKWLLLIPQ